MRDPAPDARLLRRVRLQLVAYSGTAVLLVLLVLGSALYLAVGSQLAAAGTDQLRARADDIARFIAESRVPPERAALGYIFGGESSGTFALVVDPDGDTLGPAGFAPPDALPDPDAAAAASAGKVDVRTLAISSTPVRLLTRPAVRNGRTYLVQVLQDRTGEERTLHVLLAVLAGGGLLSLLTSLLAGAAYAGRALVPIRDALRRQREFAADASHELRTPLTVLRGNLELLRRRVAGTGDGSNEEIVNDMEAEVSHLATLVDDLLTLARADSGAIGLTPMHVDLADVALEAMPTLSGFATARDVRLEVDAAPTPTTGDPVRLRQLVTILGDNAVRHSPRGGVVTIRVHPDADRSTLEVEDDGPGVRPEDLPHIFDRFWRSPTAPPGGSGLGLAIASWIVERHGGTIAVAAPSGRGAHFVVRLPAGRPPAERVGAAHGAPVG